MVKVDIDANKPLSRRWGVQAVPTLLLFEGGTQCRRGRTVGFLPEGRDLGAARPTSTSNVASGA